MLGPVPPQQDSAKARGTRGAVRDGAKTLASAARGAVCCSYRLGTTSWSWSWLLPLVAITSVGFPSFSPTASCSTDGKGVSRAPPPALGRSGVKGKFHPSAADFWSQGSITGPPVCRHPGGSPPNPHQDGLQPPSRKETRTSWRVLIDLSTEDTSFSLITPFCLVTNILKTYKKEEKNQKQLHPSYTRRHV